MLQQPGDIGRNYIADTAVGRTDDFTALDDVPESDAMIQQELFFLLDGCGNRFVCNMGKDFPETVLGMPIVKLLLAGFDGGEAPQNKNPGILAEHGCKFVGKVLVI